MERRKEGDRATTTFFVPSFSSLALPSLLFYSLAHAKLYTSVGLDSFVVCAVLCLLCQVTLFWCRGCGRYQRPPYVHVELESREMLALCLQKIKGLNKEVKLVDASFIWTEPHSKRIKVKLTIQKEVFHGAILQQQFVVEFVIQNQQCTGPNTSGSQAGEAVELAWGDGDSFSSRFAFLLFVSVLTCECR